MVAGASFPSRGRAAAQQRAAASSTFRRRAIADRFPYAGASPGEPAGRRHDPPMEPARRSHVVDTKCSNPPRRRAMRDRGAESGLSRSPPPFRNRVGAGAVCAGDDSHDAARYKDWNRRARDWLARATLSHQIAAGVSLASPRRARRRRARSAGPAKSKQFSSISPLRQSALRCAKV